MSTVPQDMDQNLPDSDTDMEVYTRQRAGEAALFILPIRYSAYLWWKERPRWAAVVLAGFGSVYLPWVLVPRLTFIYHYFTAVPFLVVALCGVFSLLYEKGPFARRLTFPGGLECQGATLLLAAFAAGCLLLFAVYFPVLSGAPTTREYADALELFDSWYFS